MCTTITTNTMALGIKMRHEFQKAYNKTRTPPVCAFQN